MAEGWAGSFDGDLTSFGLTSDGKLTLTFVVNLEDKPTMWPITDVRGKAFHVDVRCDSERVFLSTDLAPRASGAHDEAKAKIRRMKMRDEVAAKRAARDGR